MQSIDGAVVQWILNQGTTEYTNTAYLSSRNQYRMSILRTNSLHTLSCRCPIPMPTYIDCQVSLVFHVCIRMYVVYYAYIKYLAYSYTK